jgi:hypothetical protein
LITLKGIVTAVSSKALGSAEVQYHIGAEELNKLKGWV